jgi:hypothetical protein
MLKKLLTNQKGMAVALALLISVVLLGLGLALLFLAYMEEMSTNYSYQGSQAFYASDVESAYMAVGRRVIAAYNNWSEVLGANAPPPAVFCQAGNPVPPQQGTCVDQVPATYQDLHGQWCYGRVLRVPPGEAWNLGDPNSNPFRFDCEANLPDGSQGFCNCRLVLPNGSTLPQRVTFYVRNDLEDGTISQDNNGEIQLIAVSEIPSLVSTKSVLAYDLSAWMTEGLTYDIHQTGSIQKQTTQ